MRISEWLERNYGENISFNKIDSAVQKFMDENSIEMNKTAYLFYIKEASHYAESQKHKKWMKRSEEDDFFSDEDEEYEF